MSRFLILVLGKCMTFQIIQCLPAVFHYLPAKLCQFYQFVNGAIWRTHILEENKMTNCLPNHHNTVVQWGIRLFIYIYVYDTQSFSWSRQRQSDIYHRMVSCADHTINIYQQPNSHRVVENKAMWLLPRTIYRKQHQLLRSFIFKVHIYIGPLFFPEVFDRMRLLRIRSKIISICK